MLTPAVEAFGWPTVIVILSIAGLSAGVLVWDFRRFCRDRDRLAAKQRHPAGRHRTGDFPAPYIAPEGEAVTQVIPAVETPDIYEMRRRRGRA